MIDTLLLQYLLRYHSCLLQQNMLTLVSSKPRWQKMSLEMNNDKLEVFKR